MRKYLFFLSIITGVSAYGQTNTFPTSGSVGIGTTSPQSPLHIQGGGISKDAIGQYNGHVIIQANPGSRSATSGAQLEFVIPANADGGNPWGQGRIITVAGNASDGNATGMMILGTRRMFNKTGVPNTWNYGDDIVIDGNGNIGIGTTTPNEKFSVSGGSLLLDNARWYAGKNASGTTSPLLGIGSDNNVYLGDVFGNAPNNNVILRANGNDKMTLTPNGNVGIGTSVPTAKLMVSNGALVLGANSIITNKDGHLSIGNINENSTPTSNNNSWTDSTTFLLSAKNYSTIGFHQSGSRVDFIRVGSGTIQLGYDGGWGAANVGLPQGIWNAQGNVGIGTTNPQSKLAVNGIITTREVNVIATGWADYVFDSSYELKPLTVVASYIQENKHLPNIPSAEEVSKNGIALGEMNKKLLEKVEELTLYAIKQNEEIKELKTLKEESRQQKEKVDLLEKQNTELLKRLEKLENKK